MSIAVDLSEAPAEVQKDVMNALTDVQTVNMGRDRLCETEDKCLALVLSTKHSPPDLVPLHSCHHIGTADHCMICTLVILLSDCDSKELVTALSNLGTVCCSAKKAKWGVEIIKNWCRPYFRFLPSQNTFEKRREFRTTVRQGFLEKWDSLKFGGIDSETLAKI
jgi:hypothetical protein